VKLSSDSDKFDLKTKIMIALALALAIGAIVIYSLGISFLDLIYPKSARDLKSAVGSAIVVEGDCYARKAEEPGFDRMQLNDSVFPNETVMVDQQQRLVILFLDGSKLELGPNSMVKISFEMDFALAELMRRGGSMFARKPVVEVLAGGEAVSGSGLKLLKQKGPGTLPRQDILPSARPTPTPSPTPTPTPTPTPVATKKPPEPGTPIPVAPADGAVITREMLERDHESVLFSWRTLGPKTTYILELAADADFKIGLVQRRTNRNFFLYTDMPGGVQYWRVKTITGKISRHFMLTVRKK
jgi:hypothetical protein